MTILVGYPPTGRAKGVMRLACMLARSSGEELIVCTVIPGSRFTSTRSVEQQKNDDALAEQSFANARKDFTDGVSATFISTTAHSIAGALIDTAEERGVSMIVVGSAMGFVERVTVSSIADRLLHSSPIPVAIAPRGFSGTDRGVERVTLAFSGDEHSEVQLPVADGIASRFGAALRLASFAVDLTAASELHGTRISRPAVEAWETSVRTRLASALAANPEIAQHDPDFVIGQAYDWEDALDSIEWTAGDVLLVGSSPAGPLSRVFVGSKATKIMRNAPVPVIALPRTTTGPESA